MVHSCNEKSKQPALPASSNQEDANFHCSAQSIGVTSNLRARIESTHSENALTFMLHFNQSRSPGCQNEIKNVDFVSLKFLHLLESRPENRRNISAIVLPLLFVLKLNSQLNFRYSFRAAGLSHRSANTHSQPPRKSVLRDKIVKLRSNAS